MQIRVIGKGPRTKPFGFKCDNTLSSFQAFVGGDVQSMPLSGELTVLYSGESEALGREKNCRYGSRQLYGYIMIVGTDGEKYDSVKMSMQELRSIFPQLWP